MILIYYYLAHKLLNNNIILLVPLAVDALLLLTIARLAFLLSPDLVIIGGGVSRKADKFLPVVQSMVKLPVVPAQLQNQAGLVGAALVAAEYAVPA